MKKTVSIILAILIAVSLTFVFVACSNGVDGKDGIDGKDGKDGVDGVNGTNGINGKNGKDGKSAYQIYCDNYPQYTGDELQWLEDLANGKLVAEKNYKIISYGRTLGGNMLSGSASSNGSTMKFDKGIVRLDTPIVLPVGYSSTWEIRLGGVLLNGNGGAQLLNSSSATANGRVYIGVKADDKVNIVYLGVNIDGTYFNYCWDVPSNTLQSDAEYVIRYSDGDYCLSVDGGEYKTFSSFNYNQSNTTEITYAQVACDDFNSKVKAIFGQEYITFGYFGAEGFEFNGSANYLDATVSSAYGYAEMSAHPLSGMTIYHLGSSISYGSANGGKSFAEQIGALTGSKYVKETQSGTTLSTSRQNSYVSRWSNLTFADKPEFLVLQLSTNDFTQTGIDLGTVGSATSGFDTTTTAGAIEHIIAETRKKSPDTKVVIYTCAVKDNWGQRSRYAAFIDDQLQKIVKKWDILTVDLYNSYPLFTGKVGGVMSDDIHPTGVGYAAICTPIMINVLTDYVTGK